ncbi:MAG: mechanosensitive ion channel [Myxococcota bacterium]
MPFLAPDLHIAELALVALFLSLALITFVVVLRTVRRLLSGRPQDSRNAFAGRRLVVVAEVVLGVALALVATGTIAQAGPHWASALGLASFLAALAAFWFVLREYAAGLVLRATDTIRIGDAVRAAAFEGNVKHIGRLWLVLETRDAVEARLPWSRVLSNPVERSAAKSRDSQHHFRVEFPDSLDAAAAITIAREAILTTHGAHPTRDPAISVVAAHTLEVDATTLLPGAASGVEAAVRKALGSPEAEIAKN